MEAIEIGINERIIKLQHKVSERGLDAAVIYSIENRRYFAGFAGSSGALVIASDQVFLLTDFRYIDEAREKCSAHFEVMEHPGGRLVASVGKLLKELDFHNIGVEESLSMKDSELLNKETGNLGMSFIETEIMDLRKIKDETEIAHIREGIRICDLAFDHILKYIKPGLSEKEIGLELEYVMKKNGAEGIKENHVIASGPRSSLPHGQATGRNLQSGDFLKMDFGAKVNGYYTDFTRTVVLGEPSEKQLEIYQIVSSALEKTLEYIGPGKVCSDVDNVGRSIIADAGYGENFGHSLGHSLGLNIHESPAMRSTDHTELEPGMVITVEPGIYISDWGGVRIEDLVVIREDGIENLTKATKELQIIHHT